MTAGWTWWLPPEPPSPRGLQNAKVRAEQRMVMADWRARGAVGGRVRVGTLFVQDVETDAVAEHELFVDLAAGWGADVDAEQPPTIGPIRFVDATTLEVTLPNDTTQTISLAK